MFTRCVSVSAASTTDCNIANACVASSTCRRFQRSTHTPAKGASRKMGICPTNATVPSRIAEPVSRYTSQAVAIRVIHVPISEMLWPPKKRRKFRCLSARHACDTSGKTVLLRTTAESSAIAASFSCSFGSLKTFCPFQNTPTPSAARLHFPACSTLLRLHT